MKIIYEMNFVKKFDSWGNFLPYNGISIISFLSSRHEKYWMDFYELLNSQPMIRKYYTPVHPSSYHVCIKDLFKSNSVRSSMQERDWLETSLLSISGLMKIMNACTGLHDTFGKIANIDPYTASLHGVPAGPFLKFNFTGMINDTELAITLDANVFDEELRYFKDNINNMLYPIHANNGDGVYKLVFAYRFLDKIVPDDQVQLASELDLICRYLNMGQPFIQVDTPNMVYYKSLTEYISL